MKTLFFVLTIVLAVFTVQSSILAASNIDTSETMYRKNVQEKDKQSVAAKPVPSSEKYVEIISNHESDRNAKSEKPTPAETDSAKINSNVKPEKAGDAEKRINGGKAEENQTASEAKEKWQMIFTPEPNPAFLFKGH